jgi:hypothetical protein
MRIILTYLSSYVKRIGEKLRFFFGAGGPKMGAGRDLENGGMRTKIHRAGGRRVSDMGTNIHRKKQAGKMT